jgi:hypothetical protein
VRAGDQPFLVDCGRGVLQRAAAIGVGANGLSAPLLTHLRSDHIADLGDVLITRWVTTFAPDPIPLPIIGPPGTAGVVEATLRAFGPDIGYRIAHHADLTAPPPVEVREHPEGEVWDRDGVSIRVAPTDHRPVAPTIGFWIESEVASVVLAGDTVPCEGLDELATGADALSGGRWQRPSSKGALSSAMTSTAWRSARAGDGQPTATRLSGRRRTSRMSVRRRGNSAPATSNHTNAEIRAIGRIGPSPGQTSTSVVNSARAAVASPTQASGLGSNPRMRLGTAIPATSRPRGTM